jgi:hypothetical protein
VLSVIKETDLIIATPTTSLDIAVVWGEMFRKKVVAFIFEPINVIAEAIDNGIPIRFDDRDPAWIDFVKQIRKVNMIVCNNEYMAKRTKEWMPNYHGKIEYLYNGVNTTVADSIQKYSMKEREHSIVYCSRTEEYKGFGDIPYIFSQVKNKPKIHYITGFFDKMNPVHIKFVKVCKEDLKLDFVLHNRICEKEKFELIAKSKVLFFPSKFEGFGLPPGEAFYVGTPVVCNDLPVLKEIYRDYPHYMPLGDLDYGIELFNQLLDDDGLLFRKIDAAKAHVSNFITVSAFSQSLNNLIESFMGNKVIKKELIIPTTTSTITTNPIKELKKICVVSMGDESSKFIVGLGNQLFKEFNKINIEDLSKLDLSLIKEEIIVLCNGRISLTKHALEEAVRIFLDESKSCLVGDFRIGEDKIHIPEFSYESLFVCPTMFCGFIAIRKSVLKELLPISSRFWELELLSNVNESYTIKTRKIMYHLDEPIYDRISPTMEDYIASKSKSFSKVHDIKKISESKQRIITQKSYVVPKSLVIILARTNKYLRGLLKSIKMGPNLDIVVCHHIPEGKCDGDVLETCFRYEIPVVKYNDKFNFSKMNNEVIRKYLSDHKLIYLINDDIILHPDCLNSIASMFEYRWKNVGVVGAKLIYPTKENKFPEDDIGLYGKDFAKIQHAGVQLLRDRRCTHRLLHAPYNVISSNIKKICQAVTFAVVGISVECYNEIKLDEDMPNDWNDIDFCIRARKGGWKVVYDADALAIHLETATRKEFKETLNSIGKELFIKRHEDLLKKQISYADLRDNECFGY